VLLAVSDAAPRLPPAEIGWRRRLAACVREHAAPDYRVRVSGEPAMSDDVASRINERPAPATGAGGMPGDGSVVQVHRYGRMPLTRHPLPPRIVLLAAATVIAAVVATVAAVLDCARAHDGTTARGDPAPAVFKGVVEGCGSRVVTVWTGLSADGRMEIQAAARGRHTGTDAHMSPAGAAARRSGG
jgi:hypothetical protein